MSNHKVPAALIKSNIGEIVEVRTWKQFAPSRDIESDSEKTYVGRLEGFVIFVKGVVVYVRRL